MKGPLARPITSTPKSQFKKSFVAEGSSPPSPVLHSSLICGNGVSPNSSDPSNTSLIHSRSPTSISELYEGKKSFFLPPSLKPRGPSIDLIKFNSKLILSAFHILCVVLQRVRESWPQLNLRFWRSHNSAFEISQNKIFRESK